MDAKTRTAKRIAREFVAKGFVFQADTRTKEERIAQLRKNIASKRLYHDASNPGAVGLLRHLESELAKLEAE